MNAKQIRNALERTLRGYPKRGRPAELLVYWDGWWVAHENCPPLSLAECDRRMDRAQHLMDHNKTPKWIALHLAGLKVPYQLRNPVDITLREA